MFPFNRICVAGAVIFVVAAIVMASGCNAACPSGLRGAADVRAASKLVEAGTPQLIIGGPARFLHVDMHDHKALSVYCVKRDVTDAADCTGWCVQTSDCCGRAQHRAQSPGARRRGDPHGQCWE